MASPDFWSRQEESQKVIGELKGLKARISPFERVEKGLHEARELSELANEDASIESEISQELDQHEKGLKALEKTLLFSEADDISNVVLSINAGAGGTESCDWAEMLFRMYARWSQSKGYTCEELDSLSGEEAGIKSVTVMIKGAWAYGLLKSENGVHRLVRISPFDSNKRRHTSFASVDVIPEVRKEIEIEINPVDLRIDTYRAGGRGGQHVNVTDSAVRITHQPTGIVVQCQNERSQHKNKASAMTVLKARIYERKMKEERARIAKRRGEKMENAWGSQIRSYVLHPYNMIKDHRTQEETSNSQAVLDGDLDRFMEAFLQKSARKGTKRN
jgi:peptide chain release factor 2